MSKEGRTSPQGPARKGGTGGLDHMGSAWGSIPLTLCPNLESQVLLLL